jgi:hypothetical protein
MPTLRLGKIDDWIGIRLLSFMVHPNDEKIRKEYLAWLSVQSSLEWAKMVEKKSDNKELKFQLNAYDELKTLIKAPSYKEVIERGENSIKEASIAGEILYAICSYHHFYKTNKVGVNKAVWLIEESMDRRRSTALKVVKRRKILNYWKEYKSVAHFWCALRLLKYKFGVKGYPDCTPLQNKENTLLLIAAAEEIRKFGEHYLWHKNEPSVLPRGECLRLPKSFPAKKFDNIVWPKPSPRQNNFLADKYPPLKRIFKKN